MNRVLTEALRKQPRVGAPPFLVERVSDDFHHHDVVGFGVAIWRRPQALSG